MTRVRRYPSRMGGWACEPAPTSWVQVLGLWVVGLLAAMAPEWAWQWAAKRWPGLEDGPGEEA